MKENKILVLTALLAVVIIAVVAWSYDKRAKMLESEPVETATYVTHRDRMTGFNFTYPLKWGSVDVVPGNQTCPEEDTYRTADTLSVFDSEYQFDDTDLPKSDSFIRSGIRLYEVDPSDQNGCGDEFILMLAKGEFNGEALSSFKLERFESAEYVGYYNPSASRLDTEFRAQYLLFPKGYVGGKLTVIQPYMSFIPYAGSPEIKEIDADYPGDIASYVNSGRTSGLIRERVAELKTLPENIRVR